MALGFYLLLIAFMIAAYTIWAGVSGIRLKNNTLIQNGKKGVYIQFLFVTISIVLLGYAFLMRDFSFRYVAEYSDRRLPLLYTISAVWAGQAGSILFWAWLLTIFNALFVFVNRKRESKFFPYVFTINSVVTLFFLILAIYATNPFEKLAHPPMDGNGLNPLLQNPGMIFHPPSLFLGFVGFTVPFAFALAALIRGDFSNTWIEESRNWTLFAWLSLTIGNLLGAQWAYVELGWGGYWAWDPVENASLLPWLTGTAFVHSIMVQRSRNTMKTWNVILIIITFFLTILGTFITRSGIISSVHAFGRSNIGTYFLVFMGLIIVVSTGLLIWRWSKLKSELKIDSILSRDFSFLLVNIVFAVLTAAILWGTLYPAFTELFIGKQIALGEPYFNRISVPIGIFLIFLLAICPLFSWKQTKSKEFTRRLLVPSIATVIFLIVLFLGGIRELSAILVLGFAFLTVAVIIEEIVRGVATRKQLQNESSMQAFRQVMKLNTRRYAGYLIHLGVVMIYVAIVGTTVYKQEKEITLQKGNETTIGHYRLVYYRMSQHHEPNKDILRAELGVYKDGKKLGEIHPERHFNKSGSGKQQVTSEVSVYTNLKEDLYVILHSYQEDESATFVILVNPLMIWMWIGGLVISIGIIIILVHSIGNKKNKLANTKQVAKKNKKA